MAMALIPSGSTASWTRPPLLVGSAKQTPRTECSECLFSPLPGIFLRHRRFSHGFCTFPPQPQSPNVQIDFQREGQWTCKWAEQDMHLMQPSNSEEVLQLGKCILKNTPWFSGFALSFWKNVNVAIVPHLHLSVTTELEISSKGTVHSDSKQQEQMRDVM